ncbi:PIN domain-containing protein [Thiomicrospira microaerophila]|uniref:PIN domain-containing protein n=1 Tax=Thiomicrospira microaerophila TaxID=406020 RepID=UPI0005C832F3|nr:PIN domain-containing protein [Thiomicrospira microaerophila]
MSGNDRYLLDTNALIYLLEHGPVLPKSILFYSSITKIELLAYPNLDKADESHIRSVLALMQEIRLSDDVVEQTIHIRKAGSLKLPDSLILASALCERCLLVSDDKKLQAHKNVISIDMFMGICK